MNVAIVGGGPSGLRAAELLSQAGIPVTLYEAMPSVGRKLLVAGRGGLNLTHSEPMERFATRYHGSFQEEMWTSLLKNFSNADLRSWARSLGVETFVGTSGRVFPRELQSAHLLRRWIRRLREQGVLFQTRHRLLGIQRLDDQFHLSFFTPRGTVDVTHQALLLALGGASWPRTGSDGAWRSVLAELGVTITPFSPANCGWEVNWHPDIPSLCEGEPLKNLSVSANGLTVQGELLITREGLEGGALYQLGYSLRSMANPELILDLKPTFSREELAHKITAFEKDNILATATRAWRLSSAASALLRAYTPMEATLSSLTLAFSAKALRLPLLRPRPIDEAISTAGGVSFADLDDHLMVRSFPGLFLAGEMLDWEAPTGGYLLQGCFATGTRAARGAIHFMQKGD